MFRQKPWFSSFGFPRALHALPVLCVIIVILAGCGAGASPSDASAGSHATSVPSPTPTMAEACQTILRGATLIAATAGSGFSDVAFPPNSFSTSITTSHGGDGRFTIKQFDVCSYASGVSAIRSFFASGLPSSGWTRTATYPYNGAYQASCGDPYCWRRGVAPRYVSLEHVTDQHNGYITYHMRLAVPPRAPTCTPDPINIYSTRSYDGPTLSNANGVPTPPLTKDGLGSAGVNGNVGEGGYSGECSAGSAAALNSFFTTELPALGWHHSAPPSTLAVCGPTFSGTQWWKGNEIFQWSAGSSAGASGIFWAYYACWVS